ncbi:MAG: hypothetical protein N2D54_05510 [Chloroflexota bacterium]
MSFPGESFEGAFGKPLNRVLILIAVLSGLLFWREKITTIQFMQKWEKHLAFINQDVELYQERKKIIKGKLVGLTTSGKIRIEQDNREIKTFQAGEIQLRPLVDS